MSDDKRCDGCQKSVPTCVRTCDDCMFKRLAAPGMTKENWIKSLMTKSAKGKDRKPRKPNNRQRNTGEQDTKPANK